METDEKTIASTEEGGAVSMSPSTALLALQSAAALAAWKSPYAADYIAAELFAYTANEEV